MRLADTAGLNIIESIRGYLLTLVNAEGQQFTVAVITETN